ncbi:MAG: DUF3575 domain-containing protein [Bacteroidales bacterium]|nr:DUF3575 domain-containing protein [Bacteroidales bacterium]
MKTHILKRSVVTLFSLLAYFTVNSQEFSCSTNLADLAFLGGINTSFSYAFSRHWSADAGVVYRPFTFRQGQSNQFQVKTRSVSVGARYWLWHCYSGFYVNSRIKIQEYNEGGIVSPVTNEGERYGLGIGVGYAYMLSSHINIEAGWGLWSGLATYKKYSCPRCGDVLEQGKKVFLLPDTLNIAISYIF